MLICKSKMSKRCSKMHPTMGRQCTEPEGHTGSHSPDRKPYHLKWNDIKDEGMSPGHRQDLDNQVNEELDLIERLDREKATFNRMEKSRDCLKRQKERMQLLAQKALVAWGYSSARDHVSAILDVDCEDDHDEYNESE